MYDSKSYCNHCGKKTNEITKILDNIEGIICECTSCGKKDFWATGHFLSGEYVVGKAKQYGV